MKAALRPVAVRQAQRLLDAACLGRRDAVNLSRRAEPVRELGRKREAHPQGAAELQAWGRRAQLLVLRESRRERRLLMEPPKSDAVASQEALAELHQRDGPAPAQRQAQLPAQFQDDQVLADLKVQPREHVHHWQGPGERRMRPAGVEHPGLAYPA
jgi:hypothetical protein